jgi:hypothetical protein
MRRSRKTSLLCLAPAFGLVLAACGKDNLADCEKGKRPMPCSERTADEEARLALDDQDWDRAIEILSELVADDPETYARYPLLAAAYAARAGFDLFKFAKSGSQSGGDGEGGDSPLTAVNAFLPSPQEVGEEAYAAGVVDMGRAVETLNGIPVALLEETSGEDYASSALLLLTIYQTSYAFMYIQMVTVSATTGELDPARIETMTEDEAIAILDNLEDVASLPEVSGNAQVQAQVAAAVAEINAQDGATTRERLRAYMEAQEAAKAEGAGGG